MSKKKVVVTDYNYGDMDIEQEIIAETGCEIGLHQCKDESEVESALNGVDVALVQMAPVNADAVKGMSAGATLVRYGAGYDNIDTAACARHGVAVANVPDYGTEEVAVHAMALLLALLRRVHSLDSSTRQGRWESSTALSDALSADEVTLGLFGVGRIGVKMAGFAQAFSMKVIGHDPYADEKLCRDNGIELVAKEQLWQRSDAISFHAPLTDDTRHVLDEQAINALRPHAIVVNCARGGLIDNKALAKALHEGHVAAAGLDVFDQEPLPRDHPLVGTPNTLLTPHAAWCAKRPMRRLRELAAQEAARAIRGEPLRCPVQLG